MNKRIATVLSLVLAAGFVIAGTVDRGTFSTTQTQGGSDSTVVIDKGNGQIVNQGFHITSESNATITVYRPIAVTEAWIAEAADNEIYLKTPQGSNVVGGVTIAAADSILAYNASSGWQLVGVAAISTYTAATNITLIDLDANVTVSANDKVYICDAGDNVSIAAVAASDQTGLQWMFTGFDRKPVAVTLPGANGVGVMSGTYTVED